MLGRVVRVSSSACVLRPRSGLLLVRHISATALFDSKYPLPANVASHPVSDVLDEVKQAAPLLAKGATREASALLERAHAIGSNVFGEHGEFSLFIQHLLASSCFNAERYTVAEKHLRLLLRAVDETSPIDRFAVRGMLVNCLRLQNRVADAANECRLEPSDTPEQRVLMLILQSFLLMRCKGGAPPHAPLNEAAELSAQLSAGREQSRYLAIIFALQGTLSLEAGKFDEAMERAGKGLKAVSQLRQTDSAAALAMELGDLLTVQGKAQLGLQNYLRAEELLDEALSSFETGGGAGKEGRCAEALLALGTLFRDTQSLTYAEGVYRRLMRLISQGGVDRDHTHEAYDRYAWFLRSQKRIAEAEEIEQEYIRLHLKQ